MSISTGEFELLVERVSAGDESALKDALAYASGYRKLGPRLHEAIADGIETTVAGYAKQIRKAVDALPDDSYEVGADRMRDKLAVASAEAGFGLWASSRQMHSDRRFLTKSTSRD